MKKEKVVLVDSKDGGHHSTYIMAYAEALLELGNTVLIFYPVIEIFGELKKKYGDKIKTIEIQKIERQNPWNSFHFLNILSLWINIKRESKKIMGRKNPDLVFFLYLDYFLSKRIGSWVLDLFFDIKWSGLFFARDINMEGNMDRMIGSKYCKFIGILEEKNNTTALLSKKFNKKTYVFPEITNEDKAINIETKNRINKLSHGRIVVSLLGNIAERKGIDVFSKLIGKIDSKKYFFIIAGESPKNSSDKKMSDIIDKIKKEKNENLLLITDRVPDGPHFNTLVQCSNIIFAVYENFVQSSNIMTKAALFKKYIIVADNYFMAEKVKQYSLGVAVMEKDVNQCMKAIENLSNNKDLDGNIIQPRFNEYFANHSKEKLKEIFSEIEI